MKKSDGKSTYKRKYYFTCCSIIEGELKAETLFTETRDDAFNLFKSKWNSAPLFLDGPFYRKIEKNKKNTTNQEIKLGKKMISGFIKRKPVKGVMLEKPENYVFLTFCQDKDIKQKIVHISEIKETNE